MGIEIVCEHLTNLLRTTGTSGLVSCLFDSFFGKISLIFTLFPEQLASERAKDYAGCSAMS